jgi:hypothetical protein
MEIIIALTFLGLAAVVIIDGFVGAANWMIGRLFDFEERPYWVEALADALERD